MSSLTELLGKELGPTEWFEVAQERIDEFARATDDPQWIHVDPVRAAEGPFGTTVAHGFLTLSLCVPLLTQTLAADGVRDEHQLRRQQGPLPGARAVRLADPRDASPCSRSTRCPAATRASSVATVEREGGDKPVCVAELVVRRLR